MAKQKWLAVNTYTIEQTGGKPPITFKVYSRFGRSSIIVRVEKDGDTSKYAEWDMPKSLGLDAAMHQAALQTNEMDLQP